ncbi:thiamine phosphate synthase [Bacillus massiliglaciei]|uniref:thiamine phosphate synthase n=1 Tax=Bacillus massiliglaciei TaxID=1816693 RepID=UPI000DA5FB17|nr:thiamine phosphate synthase [Bacillus massiliglaciei]
MKRSDLAVYFIMGTADCLEEPLAVLEDALKAGVSCFQLREKGESPLEGEELERFARECQTLCRQYGVPFIINDDIELALKLEADGVHVGQDDTSLAEIRETFAGKIIGVSVHTAEEMTAAVQGGADYVGIGPIFATRSKADAKPPAGIAFLSEARKQYPDFPIVAIGGITADNAGVPLQAGADGVSVISAICRSASRAETVKKLRMA